MVQSLKETLKSIPVTDFLAKCLLTFYYGGIMRGIEIFKIFLRKHAKKPRKKYEKLYGFKDKYAGKRCFIIANGPSLTLSDCELLKDEFTFGMNSIIDIFDKTTWRPTFYGVQDRSIYPRLKERLLTLDIKDIFVADFLLKEKREWERFIPYPLYLYDHRVCYFIKHFKSKFSPEAHVCVYDGYSITCSLIQIAYYLGFREIYLLGCDCSWQANTNEGNHFAGGRTFGDVGDLSTVRDRNLAGYRAARAFFETHEGQIINCTRGGALEEFPRKTLEDVLAERVNGE